MGFKGFVISMLSLFFGIIAFFPFLGWLNWFVIPSAILGLVLSFVGVIKGGGRLLGILGFIISAVVVIVATLRLIIGLGII